MSYVSKSGTNAYHGNANYWWTGSSMDANSWFNGFSNPTLPTPFNNNNAWAASVGGPIKKDKLFFFADWEGIRYIVPTTTTIYVPTVGFADQTLANLASTGNAASIPPLLQDVQPVPGRTRIQCIEPDRQHATNPGGCLDLAGTPGPGGVPFGASNPCFQQFVASPSEPAKEWLLTGRVDYNMSDKDHLFWSVSFDHGTQATYADPINPAFSAASYQPQYNGQGQWTHTFGSNATNQFVYAGSYYRAIFTQNDAAATFPAWVFMGLALGYTDMAHIESVFPQGRNATQYQFVDDFSVTKGAHNLKFGGNYRRYDITDYIIQRIQSRLAIRSADDPLRADRSLQRRRRLLPVQLSEPRNLPRGPLGLGYVCPGRVARQQEP